MNDYNKNLLNGLNEKEYKNFLQSALGMEKFLASNFENDNYVLRSTQKRNNKDKSKKDGDKIIFAYFYDTREHKVLSYYWFSKEEYKSKLFIFYQSPIYNSSTSYLEKNKVYEYFDKKIHGDIITYLLFCSKENYNYAQIFNPDFGKNSFYQKFENAVKNDIKNNSYKLSFIVGSGISKSFTEIGWEELINNLKSYIISKLGTDSDTMEKFQEDIGNTSYVIPQIVKDLDKTMYYQIIYDGLYSNFSSKKINIETNPNLENETIYQVATAIALNSQIYEQDILTFNYDDFLERIININFSLLCESVFQGEKSRTESNIKINHVHGFLPYNDGKIPGENYKNSVILSNYEYMDAYDGYTSKAYKALYNQLHKKNLIIGNSVADYEEQKVFRNHHNTYLSEYNYLFTTKNKHQWINDYKTIYFFNLGIIPIFFENHNQIAEFLRDLKNKSI